MFGFCVQLNSLYVISLMSYMSLVVSINLS